MSQTVSVGDIPVGGYQVSVTTRHNGEPQDMMEELTYRTIKAWVVIVTKFLEQQVYILPLADDGNLRGSVEQAYAWEINKQRTDTDGPPLDQFAFAETFGDARVTCWDTFKSNPRISFHLNSDDIPQVAVDTWLANQRGIQRAFEEFGGIKERVQNAIKPPVDASNSSAAPSQGSDAPATPKAQNSAPSGTFYSKKDAITKLKASDPFKMKIVQIKKRSTDGKDFYEFYEPYGGKPGDFSAVSVFTDNEIAINNGLIAYLDTLGIKLGQALTGNWVLNCSVGKPKTKSVKGEEKTFTNIYVNSFEGQPEHA